MSNPIPMIEAITLTKRYEDGVLALDHVSFQVFPGQIYTMLGANGSGKTTTINLFLDFIKPTEGETRIDGHNCAAEPLYTKSRLAYVSENVMLYPNFSALANLEYFAGLSGHDHSSREKLSTILSRVGLPAEVHHKKLREFSKGMRQKCGIAIAILKNAPAILLDEPTSGLDPKAGYEFMMLLNSLKDEGKAILMSTHDIFRAKDSADTIGILKAGQMVMQKSARELAGENLEELYLRYMSGHSDSKPVPASVSC